MTHPYKAPGLIRGLVLLLATVPAWAVAQTDTFIIFGDSLSDAGNFFHQRGEVLKAPFAPVPRAPYAIGGNHFSNGATWVEQLVVRVGAAPSAHPALVNPGRFTNYAFGRARARANAPVFSDFDLTTQVALFLSNFGNAPSDATYIVFIGSNDARDALAEFAAGNAPGGLAIVNAAVTAIATNVAVLAQSGAKKIVVLNIPNLAITPAINDLPAPLVQLATGFSISFNFGALSAALDSVEPLVQALGGQLIRVDVFSLLNDVVADGGAAAGLSNVTDPCLTYGVKGNFMCNNPNEYLFWDDAHPTRAGHGVLVEEIANILAAP